MTTLEYLISIADPEGLCPGVNARTISRAIDRSYDQTKREIIGLIRAGEIDRLTEPTDEDGVLIVYNIALAAARAEESDF